MHNLQTIIPELTLRSLLNPCLREQFAALYYSSPGINKIGIY